MLILGVAIFIGRESVSWLLDRVLDFATQGIGSGALVSFPWQSALATVMALLGGYLAFWPSKKEEAVPSPRQRARTLGVRASNITARLNMHRAPFGRVAEARDPFYDIVQEGISLLLSFEKEGFAIPKMQSLAELERRAVCMLDYFSRIGPLSRDGHINEAKQVSQQLADNAVEQGKQMQLGYFH